jgi:hypothetical protein
MIHTALVILLAGMAAVASWRWRQTRRTLAVALASAIAAAGVWWLAERPGGDSHARDREPSLRGDLRAATPPKGGGAAQPVVLERGLHALEDAERELARERWDPTSVVARVGRDPDAIFDWVRGNTYWVPYHGVLRGPQGVLMDRQGNDIDRALLLSALLTGAGHTARLAHARLARDQAAALLPLLIARRHRPGRPTERPAPDAPAQLRLAMTRYDVAQPALAGVLASQGERMLRAMDTLRSRTAVQSAQLLAVLRRRPDSANWGPRLDSATEVLRDHWWVQLQRGPDWTDLDLDAPQRSAGSAPASPEETIAADALDSTLYHRVVVRLVVERWDGSALHERVALAHALRASDAPGGSLELRILPTEWPTDLRRRGTNLEAGVRAAALAQTSWQATLLANGESVADVVIRETGETAGAAAGGPFAGLGRGIIGAVGGGDRASTLTAAWLEYEIQVPMRPAETIRRTLFDLLGASARGAAVVRMPALDEAKRLERGLSLLRSTEILPLSSALAPEFVLHLSGQGLLWNRDLLRARALGTLADTSPTFAGTPAPRPLPSHLYTLALARFESKDTADVYLDRPNILARHTFLASTPRGLRVREASDIVENDVGVEPGEPDAFAARVRQGVRDTNAEAVLPLDAASFGAVALAFTAPSGWVLADSSDRATLSRLPDDARQQVTADLRGNFLVVAPLGAGSNRQAFPGWWRIDPRTGHTLGVSPSGWGQSLVERVAIAIVATWTFEYLICMGTFTWNHTQQAYAPPFPLSLATPLAAEVGGEPCSVDALISAFIVAGVEIVAVTWPLVVMTIAGKGYSGILSGRPVFATGDPAPGDLPPILGRGTSPPKPECPPGAGAGAAPGETPVAEAPPSRPSGGLPEGEGAPSGGASEGAAGEGAAPAEPDMPFYPNPEGTGPTPVNPEGVQQRATGAVANRDAIEMEVDQATIAHRDAAFKYENANREAARAKARDEELKATDPGSDEANEAYQAYLEKQRQVIAKGNDLDQAERALSHAERDLEKARYSASWYNRLAEANRKAFEARQARDEAGDAWDRTGRTDYDSPEYTRFKDASARYRDAGRELSDVYWDKASPAGGTDKTLPAPTEPAPPHGPGAPPGAPAPADACGGGPPPSPAAQSVAGAVAVGAGVGAVP